MFTKERIFEKAQIHRIRRRLSKSHNLCEKAGKEQPHFVQSGNSGKHFWVGCKRDQNCAFLRALFQYFFTVRPPSPPAILEKSRR